MPAGDDVPGYLGRVLTADGDPAGTCFQCSAGIAVTAWHVLDDVGAGRVDAEVTVDELRPGMPPIPARVVRLDEEHDLAVLRLARPLPADVPGLVDSSRLDSGERVRVQGVARMDDGDHEYRYAPAIGAWVGQALRDERVPLGVLASKMIALGMSSAPVRRVSDDHVIGVVSGRYNSADGWSRDIVWLARTEDLRPLLSGLDNALADGSALAAYLRWLAATHGYTVVPIADREVSAPIAEAPWTGTLVVYDANHYARQMEVSYLHSKRSRAPRLAALAAQPLPSDLTPATHVDSLDLAGRDTLPAQHVLDRKWRCVVLGDPGSGKTTLVRRLVLGAATAYGERGWRLPVLCVAADLVAALNGDDDPLAVAGAAIVAGWRSQPPVDPLSGEEISPDVLTGLVARAAAEQRLLLVVDGLDEVPTAELRARLVAELDRFVRRDGNRYGLPTQNPGNQLLVTSRLVGYYATPLAEPVQQLILRPMDDGAVQATGAFWLRHFALATGQGALRTKQMGKQFDRLATDSAALVSNPHLLVSLITAVATGEVARRRQRHHTITRADVYGFMVDGAVAKALRDRFPPDTRRDTVLAVQAAVAYQMHRTSRTGVFDLPSLRACVTAALATLADPPDEQRALDLVLGLGLITQRGQDLYGFLHQLLEEYLAGRWLVAVDAAARIRRHLDDPRWVEPISLGLGHLGHADPAGLDTLLTELLTGPSAEYAAPMFVSCAYELDSVRPAHVEAAVAALLAADIPAFAVDDRPATAAAQLTALLAQPIPLGGAERPADIVNGALAAALRADDGWLVAVAARTVEALGMFTRETVTALCHAQERDSPEYGWTTVRALHALASAPKPVTDDPAKAAALVAKLPQADVDQLATVRVVKSTRRAAQAGFGRSPIPRPLTPFRNAIADPAVAATLDSAGTELYRIVLCLYGGFPFRDTRRWATERARLDLEMRVSNADRTARRAAAVQLDTVVASALRARPRADEVAPAHITVDSPLTDRVLAWLTDGTPPDRVLAELGAIAADPARPAVERGDAMAALCVVDDTTARAALAGRVAELDDAVRARLVWRLERARLVLGDAAARLNVGDVVTAAEGHGVDGAELAQLSQAAARALGEVAGQAAAGGWAAWDRHAQEALVGAVCGMSVDKVYGVAVVLDTVGRVLTRRGPAGIAGMLATAHLIAPAYPGYQDDWDLDPLAPWSGEPFDEALTALDGLADHFGFLRCWLIDRMAPELVARGCTVEAFCLALRVRAADPVSAERTVARLLALVGTDDWADDADLLTRLADETRAMTDAYRRGRAQLHLDRLLGRAPDRETVVAAARSIADPTDRLRYLELAGYLGPPRLRAALAIEAAPLVAEVTDVVDRALAEARLARFGTRPRGRAVSSVVAGIITKYPDAVDRLATALGMAPDGLDGLIAPALLRHERDRTDTDRTWRLLTCAALCADALRILGSGTVAATAADDVPWPSLRDPEARAETVTALRRRGQRQMLTLDDTGAAVLDELIAAGDGDAVADLLTVCTAAAPLPAEIERWRTGPHRRIADLAALITIETRTLDVAGVAALPRLLTDRDDRVRLRTGLATSVISRGQTGRPRFTASGLGAEVLAELARVGESCDRDTVRASADLWWAISDVVHDSPAELVRALALLAGEQSDRETLLDSIRQITPSTLVQMPGMAGTLDEPEQVLLLRSLHMTAWLPHRHALRPADIARLSEPLWAMTSTASDQALAHILTLFALTVPASPAPARLHALADRATGVGIVAVGATHALGIMLVRTTVADDDAAHAAATRAREVLRANLMADDEDIAAAAATALIRCDEWPLLAAAHATGTLDSTVLLWGLMGTLASHVIGPEYRNGLRTVARFVRNPPGLSGADAAEVTGNLVAALLRRAIDALELPADRWLTWSHALDKSWSRANLLGVLMELARAQPAALRAVIDDEYPDFPGRVARAATEVHSWVVREFAPRLLVLLGTGDAASVTAVLGAADDTDIIRQQVLDELHWFEDVQPDGLAVLLSAVDDERVGRRHFAVQILMSLLRCRVLTDEDHTTALQAVQRSFARADAHEQLLTSEYNGRVESQGSFVDVCRVEFARLLAGARPLVTGSSAQWLTITVTDTARRDVELIVPQDGSAIDGLWVADGQTRYANDVVGVAIGDDLVAALNRVATDVRDVGLSMESVLTAVRQRG